MLNKDIMSKFKRPTEIFIVANEIKANLQRHKKTYELQHAPTRFKIEPTTFFSWSEYAKYFKLQAAVSKS